MRSGTPYLVRVCAYLQGGPDLQGGTDLKRGLALTWLGKPDYLLRLQMRKLLLYTFIVSLCVWAHNYVTNNKKEKNTALNSILYTISQFIYARWSVVAYAFRLVLFMSDDWDAVLNKSAQVIYHELLVICVHVYLKQSAHKRHPVVWVVFQ